MTKVPKNAVMDKENGVSSEVDYLRKQLEVERALEVIRSYTLGMRRSSELQGLVHLVSQEIRKSGMDINGGVFITINDEVDDRSVPIWGSGGAADYTQRAVVPYLDNPIFLKLRDAIREKKGLYVDHATYRQKIEFFKHLFRHDPWCHTPLEVQEQMLGLEGNYARSVSISDYTTIFILNNTGQPFSDIDNNILQSFGRVFEQSYRRFLDIILLEQKASEIKRLSDAKTQLYTNIAHEFRTPLTVIKGMADQIAIDPDRWVHDGVPMIHRNTVRLLDLVNQMLELRKLESGDASLNYGQADVIPYIRYLVSSIESLATQKEITMYFQADVQSCMMDYDQEKLQRIVINLVSNAIKYTPAHGEVNVSVTVCPASLDEQPTLQIAVADTGIGIDTENLPNIFNRFYQVDGSTTRTGEGFGIGLALVANLIKIMKGSIEVNSAMDQGTTFTIKLPITTNAEIRTSSSDAIQVTEWSDGISTSTAWAHVSEQSLEKPSLLLIEDNNDVITYIVACLYEDYEVQVAQDGSEGIELAIANTPDLIISDVMMPLKDGFEVCETLKSDSRTSHIPIVLLTAKADRDSLITGLKYGADAYMAKPFDKTELKVRLQKLLETRRSLQRHYRSIVMSSKSSSSEDVQDQFLIKLRSEVMERMNDSSFSINELIDVMGMSRSQLHRKLTALTGVPPNRFIRMIRLEKAKDLLKQSTYSVSEIAFKVGFNDPSYFGRVFKKEYDMTPIEWKESF